MATMNISLPEKLKSFVEKRVAEGDFSNASDYVRDLLRKDQLRNAASAEIRQALEDGDASGYLPYEREYFEKRFEELAKAKRQGKKHAA
jgi:antitoxin ParD1/3/4